MAPSGSILILIWSLLTQKASIRSSDHKVLHLLHKNLQQRQRFSLKDFTSFNTNTARIESPQFFFCFFSGVFFFNKTISVSFLLEKLNFDKLSRVIEIPVVVSINANTLVSLVVSGIPMIVKMENIQQVLWMILQLCVMKLQSDRKTKQILMKKKQDVKRKIPCIFINFYSIIDIC